MLKEIVNKVKSAMNNTEEINEIDEKFFAEVMKEIKAGYKEEGLEGKSIAMSGGDTDKANSIYMQLRAEALQEKAEIRQEKDALEFLENLRREKEEKAREDIKEQDRKRKKLINDKLYKALKNFHTDKAMKLYKNELDGLGFHETSLFSSYHLKKDGKGYYLWINDKEKNMIIYEEDYSSPEVTFNLEDKEDEIMALAN